MTKLTRNPASFIGSLLLAFALPAQALEYPVGAPQNMAGMEVAAV